METPYKISDLQNPSIREQVAKVMGLVPTQLDSRLLIEEIGWGLNQLDWRDENWSYAVVRGAPIWVSGRKDRRDVVIQEFVEGLKTAFGLKAVEVYAPSDEPEARVTVRWDKRSHKIWD